MRTYHKVEFSKAVIMRPTPSYSISAGSLYNPMHFSAGRGCRIRFKLICCYFARGGFLTRLHHREIRHNAKKYKAIQFDVDDARQYKTQYEAIQYETLCKVVKCDTKYNTMIVVHPFKPFDAIPVLYQQFQINLTVFVFAIGFYIVFVYLYL